MNGSTNNFLTYCQDILHGLRQIKYLRLSYIRKVFSLMGRREKIAVLILALVAISNLTLSVGSFYFNHTVLVPSNGGVYTEGLVGQPTYLNPLLAHSDADTSLVALLFSGLYKYGLDGKLAPDLADGMPQISDDQKQYTVNLKHNVKWHNDKPFTADDVVFTVQIVKDPAYKSPLRAEWANTSVEKTGDYQVVFTNKDIFGPFEHTLTTPLLPRSVWGNVGPQNFLLNEANLQPVGTGPYALREIKKLPSGKVEEMALDSFSNYYNGKPKIDTVIFKFYDSSEDVINALHAKEIGGFGFTAISGNLYLDKDRGQVNIFRTSLPQYQTVFFNLKNKFLAQDAVRNALVLATDRAGLTSTILQDNAMPGGNPLSYGPSTPQAPAAELDHARALLDQAGWKVDDKTGLRTNKGTVLEITVTTNDFLLNSKAAENLANQWKQLNIKVNLSILPTAQLSDSAIRTRKFDVLLFPQKFSPDPDPFVFWHSSQTKDPGLNLTGLSDAGLDKLLTEARTTTNSTLRQQKYDQVQSFLTQKASNIFLNQTDYIYAVDDDVKNVNLGILYDPSQRFYDLPNWYMQEKRVWK